MCNIDNRRLADLLASVERVRPMPEATDEERTWYRGMLHGLRLALRQVPPEEREAI